MLCAILLATGRPVHSQTRATSSSASQNPSLIGTLLAGSRRIVFLGDSITYSGQYVDDTEMVLRTLYPKSNFEFLDLGLPSETVSGLSEPGHAGGTFPRPDLHDRLPRLLELTHPDLVIACYGMNDGIYYPFGQERFEKFRDGIHLLHDRVIKSGAKLILLTPPVFDPQPIRSQTQPAGLTEYRKPYEGYNDVLDRYSEWLLGQRKYGWLVIDVHTPMKKHLAEHRLKDPSYALAPDGVHLNEVGHLIMAQVLLQGIQVTSNDDEISTLLSTDHGRETLKLIHSRNRLLSDAWLTRVGHKRPGMTKGLPLEQATSQATELNHQIKEKLEFSKP